MPTCFAGTSPFFSLSRKLGIEKKNQTRKKMFPFFFLLLPVYSSDILSMNTDLEPLPMESTMFELRDVVTLCIICFLCSVQCILYDLFCDDPKWLEMSQHLAGAVICTCVHLLYIEDVLESDFLIPSAKFKIPYVLFYFYWVSSILQFIFLYERSKDTHVFAVHHVVTLSALLASDLLEGRALGLYILFLHDVSDIFIATGKILFKLDHWLTSYASAPCLIIWIWTRVYLFGFKLVFCLLIPTWIAEYIQFRYTAFQIYTSGFALLCMIVLTLCHLWWTSILLKISWQYVFGSQTNAHALY